MYIVKIEYGGYMADIYKTKDGKTFTSASDAQAHANDIAASEAAESEKGGMMDEQKTKNQ